VEENGSTSFCRFRKSPHSFQVRRHCGKPIPQQSWTQRLQCDPAPSEIEEISFLDGLEFEDTWKFQLFESGKEKWRPIWNRLRSELKPSFIVVWNNFSRELEYKESCRVWWGYWQRAVNIISIESIRCSSIIDCRMRVVTLEKCECELGNNTVWEWN
jgi:hypothetical protein